MIGAELLRYQKDQKYFILDTETSGLNLGFAVPFQVSYAVFTIDKILEEHNEYIWWDDLRMSEGAAKVTRFDYARYKSLAKDPTEVLERFDSYLYRPDMIPLGHNLYGYDSMIHAVWRRKVGLPEDYSYLSRALDTVALSKAYKKGIKPDRENMTPWTYRLMGLVEKGLKTNLAQMGRDLGIEFRAEDLHDSRADVRLNIEIFRQLLWKVEV